MLMRPPAGLKEDTVIVWRISFDRLVCQYDSYFEILDDAEKTRATRYHFDKDRQSFALTRASLRLILAGYLSVESSSIQFAYNRHGKPFLDLQSSTGEPIRFNVSHSGRFGLIAVTQSAAVGVDIEYCKRDIDLIELASRFFSKGECASLKSLPESEHHMAFYRCWTRKEAYVKAVGEGLSIPLDSFDVSLDPELQPQLLRSKRGVASEWRMFDVPMEKGYLGALTTAQIIQKIQIVNFADQLW